MRYTMPMKPETQTTTPTQGGTTTAAPTPTPWYTSEGPKDEQPAAGLVAKHPTKPNMKMSIGILFEGYHAGEAQANAAFIVRAVNSHEELLRWVKQYAFDCDHNEPHLKGGNLVMLKQAITRAEGR
jgi:hypothetical protein